MTTLTKILPAGSKPAPVLLARMKQIPLISAFRAELPSTFEAGGEAYEVTLAEDANPSAVSIAPRPTVALPPSRPAVTAGGKGALTAPMPGVILEVKVKAGDAVERGQPVAVLDAMKMHNTIASPQTGVVAEVLVAAGQTVDHGELILKYRET